MTRPVVVYFAKRPEKTLKPDGEEEMRRRNMIKSSAILALIFCFFSVVDAMAQGSVKFLGKDDGDYSMPSSHSGVNSFRLFVIFTPPPSTLTIENFTATPVNIFGTNDDLNFTPMLSRLERDSTNEGIWSFSLRPNGKATIKVEVRVDGITDKAGNGYNFDQDYFIEYRLAGLPGLVADAGPDQPETNQPAILSGATVTLDGRGSTAIGTAGGRTVTYAWTRASGTAGGTGSAVTLSDPGAARPTFTAQTLAPGATAVTYIFTLTVTDNQNSDPKSDMVTITVTAPDTPTFDALVADAGPDQPETNQPAILSGATVTLDGRGSTAIGTAGGRTVTYAWTRASGTAGGTGSAVTLSDPGAARPTFTAQTLAPGATAVTYIFTLTVTDNQNSDPKSDMVTITVTAPDTPTFDALVADAGPDQPETNQPAILSGATVTLDGRGSTAIGTAGGRTVTYAWTRASGTAGGTGSAVTLSDPGAARPTFTAQTLAPGATAVTYIFTLTVTDNQNSDPKSDMVTITVTAPDTPTFDALVADAGPDQPETNQPAILSGATVTLDGRGSTAIGTAGGRTVTYAWTRASGTAGGTGSAVTLSDPGAARPTFAAQTLAPGATAVTYIFTLTVTDDQGSDPRSDTVTITVTAPAFADPVANAGPPQTVASGTTVTLDGSKSTKDDRRTIGYLWARTDGTPGKSVTLTGSNTAEPSFTADTLEPEDPDVTHVFTLTVTDNAGETDTDTVMVTVTAVMVDILVNPPDLTVQEGGSGTYQVSLSESPHREVYVIAFPDHEDVVLDNVRLVFNAKNWDTRQDVRIITVADADKEDDIARIRHRLVANGVALGQAGIVTVRVRDEDPILRPIGNYLASRATALLNNQPDLIRFLKQDETTQGGNFTLKATEGRLVMDGGFVHDGVWGEVTGSYGNSDSDDTKSVLGSFAFHRKYSENLLVGAMLQFDFSDHNLARNNGRIDGIGWLVGPYFVARHWSQPLYFEGRLFYGDSGNDIRFIDRDLGVRTGSFDTTRLLAQIRVEGEIALSDLDEGLRLIPYADARWIEDRAEAFTDRIGNRFVNRVPGQKVSTGQLELGSNVEIPVAVNHGEMTLTGGLGLVYANTEGDYITSDSRGRGRGEIGFSYGLDNNVWIDFESFYDGIGSSRYESYGLSLSAEMKF